MTFVWAYLVVGLLFVLRSSGSIISDLKPNPVTIIKNNGERKYIAKYYGVGEAVVHIALLLLAWPMFAAWLLLVMFDRGQEFLGRRGWLP